MIENETNSGFVILGIFVFAMKLVYKIRHKIVMNRIVKEHFELINDKSSFYDELT